MNGAGRLWVLLGAALLIGALALSTGSHGLQPAASWRALADSADPLHAVIVELRLPRLLAAFGGGALLALAGALLQALLRNPLADPYLLGISSGAGAFTLAAMMLGAGSLLILLAGLAGAAASVGLLFALAWRGGLLPTRLLLAGVMLSAAWGALVTLLLAVAPDAPLRGMLYWLLGDFAGITPAQGLTLLLGAVLALATAWPLAGALDALARGELTAAALGVPVLVVRIGALALAAVATAGVVLVAGSIGFIGLLVPHLVRLFGIRSHRLQLPACVLAGGGLLMLADLLARSLVAPLQLPVGALTALIGAPLFLFLLTRTAQSR